MWTSSFLLLLCKYVSGILSRDEEKGLYSQLHESGGKQDTWRQCQPVILHTFSGNMKNGQKPTSSLFVGNHCIVQCETIFRIECKEDCLLYLGCDPSLSHSYMMLRIFPHASTPYYAGIKNMNVSTACQTDSLVRRQSPRLLRNDMLSYSSIHMPLCIWDSSSRECCIYDDRGPQAASQSVSSPIPDQSEAYRHSYGDVGPSRNFAIIKLCYHVHGNLPGTKHYTIRDLWFRLLW